MVHDYFLKQVRQCKDLEELAPEYLGFTYSYIEQKCLRLKININPTNIARLALEIALEDNWEIKHIVTRAAMIELLNLKHGQARWQAHELGEHEPQAKKPPGGDFGVLLRQAILSSNHDAKILTTVTNDLIWLAVLYKDEGGVAGLTAPLHFVVSKDLHYLFFRKNPPKKLKEALMVAVNCRLIEPLKLYGPHVPSLLQMLKGREGHKAADLPRFHRTGPQENDVGIDFTGRRNVEKYTAKCFPSGIKMDSYTVKPKHNLWQGEDIPEFRLMEFPTTITFTGDVGEILKALPTTGICIPPFPEYISNFAKNGQSVVDIARYDNNA